MSTPPTQSLTSVERAAARLLAAYRDHRPGPPVRDLIGTTDLAAAYEVQQQIIRSRVRAGARIVGRKIGLTSSAVQQQVGVSTPDFGVLLDDMQYTDHQSIPINRLMQPRAEAEIAFVLASDIVDPEITIDTLANAVAYATPAIEIVDSRVAGWDICITDTVADNASSGVFVLGGAHIPLISFVPREVTMRMVSNSVTVSTGTGAECLGDPLNALLWLARTAIEFGSPLRAGEVVLSGALGPLSPVVAGHTLVATIGALGSVAITFTSGSSS